MSNFRILHNICFDFFFQRKKLRQPTGQRQLLEKKQILYNMYSDIQKFNKNQIAFLLRYFKLFNYKVDWLCQCWPKKVHSKAKIDLLPTLKYINFLVRKCRDSSFVLGFALKSRIHSLAKVQKFSILPKTAWSMKTHIAFSMFLILGTNLCLMWPTKEADLFRRRCASKVFSIFRHFTLACRHFFSTFISAANQWERVKH